jgi:hypothetical protein
LRHDWFKELLIELEKDIDKATIEKNQRLLHKEIEEESENSDVERETLRKQVENAYFSNNLAS